MLDMSNILCIIITVIICSIYYRIKNYILIRQKNILMYYSKELVKESINDQIKYDEHLYKACSDKSISKSILRNYFKK